MPTFKDADDFKAEFDAILFPQFPALAAGEDPNLTVIEEGMALAAGSAVSLVEDAWNQLDPDNADLATCALFYSLAGWSWPGDENVDLDDARLRIKAWYSSAKPGTREWYRAMTLWAGLNVIDLCHVEMRLTGPNTVHLFVGRAGGSDPFQRTMYDPAIGLQAWWDDDANHIAGDEVIVLPYSSLRAFGRVLSA
jgi:hypothetical protein